MHKLLQVYCKHPGPAHIVLTCVYILSMPVVCSTPLATCQGHNVLSLASSTLHEAQICWILVGSVLEVQVLRC